MTTNFAKIAVLKELQNKGVNFAKDYFQQSYENLSLIETARKALKYRQSAAARAMGRTPRYSFYFSLQNLAEKIR